jgi:SulP family sulfate permease
MTGIGAIIVCIQVGPFFGLPGSGGVLEALQDFVTIFSQCNKEALLLGSITLGCIYLLPLLARQLPASLIALVLATWLSYALNMNVPRIGEIPSQFPLPHLPEFRFTDLHLVLQAGITLAILGAIDSLLTSLVLDKVTGGRHSSNRELIGQGLGNIVAGFLGGLPGAGATMRSMVNVRAGGRSKFSGAFHGLVLLAVLLGLSKIASQIPLAVLAATLIAVGINIMDWRVLRRLRALPKSDVLVMLVVLLLTIFVDLIVAVLVGVALASMLFVKQLSDAKTSSAGDVNTLEELRQIAEHIPEAVRKSIYTYQFNGPLFFGEAKNLGAIVDALSEAKYIMLRFHSVPLIDQTGAYALEDAIEKWEARGIKIMFIGLEGHIRRALEATGGAAKIREEFCFEQFEDALEAIDVMEAGESTSTLITRSSEGE